ncbi:MAG: methyltransferase domain-containing protein [Candidatus Shapirobacteria bacterium]|jgi:ubiquinone/menaquinone biosynthesis C-methylase UbiE/uncharacterized protein YbaR (Trm112 family)
MKEFIDILECSNCGGELVQKKDMLICLKCGLKYDYRDEILRTLPKLSEEKILSHKKWEYFYKKWQEKKSYLKEYEDVRKNYLINGGGQIERESKLNKETIYLEIGCGSFFLGQILAKKCKLVIGIDFSLKGLKIARQMLKDQGIKNFILIHGDVFKIPLKNKSVNLIYGGGVIEHFQKTEECLRELFRVTSKKGVVINAVPILNIGSLTYRQIWGNIPDFPILKQVAEFVHIKFLKEKYMVFGYEMSFPVKKLEKMHLKAGFKSVFIKRLECPIMLDFLPKKIRPIFRWIAVNFKQFWPMGLAVAKK